MEAYNLRLAVKGHGHGDTRIAWSPNGRRLAIPHVYGYLTIVDLKTGKKRALPQRKLNSDVNATQSKLVFWCVAWSPDSTILAIGTPNGIIRFFDSFTGAELRTFQNPKGSVHELAWSPHLNLIAAATAESAVPIWDPNTGDRVAELQGHTSAIRAVAWSHKGDQLASGSKDGKIRIWQVNSWNCLKVIDQSTFVNYLAWSPDDQLLISASKDRSVTFWDINEGRRLRTLEGHTSAVTHVSFSADGKLLSSLGSNGQLCIWETKSGNPLSPPPITAVGSKESSRAISAAFHPTLPLLAVPTAKHLIEMWEYNQEALFQKSHPVGVHYMTARVILVGDSGVGKTGLAWRLAHGVFKEHPSTHGQQFWVLDQLRTKREDGTECEAVLWDFAGQPDYRIVHALFLSDADLALLLFDPTERQEPLKGVEYWLKALTAKDKTRCATILVAARSDRGTPTLSQNDLVSFCTAQGISGNYVATSALTGDGLDVLLSRIKASLPWESMTKTVTTVTFKRIKDYVLSLKEEPRTRILVSITELREQLISLDQNWRFTNHELRAAVGHLATHGYVTCIKGATGEEFVLLKPEMLSNLASSMVLEARRDSKGLGVLEESRLLRGGYSFTELVSLETLESEVLLDAATALFLSRNLCFRETLGRNTLLVFPSLINQTPPPISEELLLEDSTYIVSGAVENVYAALVVLLGYTNTFTRTSHWRNHARYEFESGQVCGFRLAQEREGEIELVLQYGENVHESTKLLFEGLLQKFLAAREVAVYRFPAVICLTCGHRQERVTVVRRVQQGRGFLHCDECGERVGLPASGHEIVPPAMARNRLRKDETIARRRTVYETALVHVKGLIRSRRDASLSPSCFISYAWGDLQQERWVIRLATDLRNAGVEVILDKWHNAAIGSDVARFASSMEHCDFVAVVGTPRYLEKTNNLTATGTVAAAELDLINQRLTGSEAEKQTVLPLLLIGTPEESLPPLIRGRVRADFRQESQYFRSLLDLVLAIFRFRFDDPAVVALRTSLEEASNM